MKHCGHEQPNPNLHGNTDASSPAPHPAWVWGPQCNTVREYIPLTECCTAAGLIGIFRYTPAKSLAQTRVAHLRPTRSGMKVRIQHKCQEADLPIDPPTLPQSAFPPALPKPPCQPPSWPYWAGCGHGSQHTSRRRPPQLEQRCKHASQCICHTPELAQGTWAGPTSR